MKKGKEAEQNEVKKDIFENLPKGVKVKRIIIGPKQILKFLLYVVIGFWALSFLFEFLAGDKVTKASLSTAVDAIKKGESSEVLVMDNEVMVTLKDGNKILVTSKEQSASMVDILQKEGVDLSTVNLQVDNRQGWKTFGDILTLVLSVGLPILVIIWFLKKQTGAAGGAGGVFGFGKSTAKLFVKGKQTLTFKDVAGVEEAKKDLEEIVDFLKNPDKYLKMGARVPKGVLLVGPSGVGKTLLAKAVAGEANVSFYSMAGSEFMEMLVGVGASRVRDLFGTAKKAGKAIIFIDEIDAIGRIRGGMDGGHGEREQTLNQILVEMDGFEPNTAVIVLAATNRGDLLDPALLRPGRFDRTVVLEMPDFEARKAIVQIHAKGKPIEKDVDWDAVARRTVGFSGADLENMMNEAAIGAAGDDRLTITKADIEEAALKSKLGAEKRRTQTEEDRSMTAYHEAGHAIVNYVEKLDPVHRISIVSRGMALGFTLVPPSRDRVHETKERLIKQMAMGMGGRAAEELIFKDITTGAASDISYTTNIARNMVTDWGMSKLGPINFGPQMDTNDYNKAMLGPSRLSETMQFQVDEEVKAFVNEAYERAKKVLKENKVKLDKIAKMLMDKETLDKDEFDEAMK